MGSMSNWQYPVTVYFYSKIQVVSMAKAACMVGYRLLGSICPSLMSFSLFEILFQSASVHKIFAIGTVYTFHTMLWIEVLPSGSKQFGKWSVGQTLLSSISLRLLFWVHSGVETARLVCHSSDEVIILFYKSLIFKSVVILLYR